MYIKQLSIFVENKPGRLAEITAVLEQNKIDIRALSISDTKDFGILRLIVTAPDAAEKALKDSGYTVSLTQVIAIGIADEPGSLAKAMRILYDSHVSVEYMYAFLSKTNNNASVILRVNDNDQAVSVLAAGGIKILQDDEVRSLEF